MKRSSLFLLLLSLWALASCGASRASPQCPTPAALAQEDSPVMPVGSGPTLGVASAPVTVLLFEDLLDPRAARANLTLARLRMLYGDALRVVWRPLPSANGRQSQLAAQLALEVFEQRGADAFWALREQLVEHPTAFDTRERLLALAERVGANAARAQEALDARRHAVAVHSAREQGSQFGAREGTTFFVNGTRVPGAAPYTQVRALLERVYARARALPQRSRAYASMVASPEPFESNARQLASVVGCRREVGAPQEDAERIPTEGAPQYGCPDALVTLVLFSDFQCPFCSRLEPTLTQLRERYGDDLRIVWRNNPLPFHQNAMPAAEAAMEAYAQGGTELFWRFHDVLFENQQALEPRDLERYAEQLDLDLDRFREALQQHTHREAIQRDMELATRLHAGGTPNSFLNGENLVGAQPLERFTTMIDAALQRARSVDPPSRAYAEGVAAAAAVAPPAPPPAPPTPAPDDTRVYTLRANPRAPSRGPANAPAVLQLFSDFQCPFCARVVPTLEALERHYGARLRIVWRDYPLAFHDHAMPAAEAAREVLAQRGVEAFWRFHNMLYQNQRALERQDLERYAQSLQLDMSRFRRALDTHAHQAAIREDMAAADAANTPGMGTPAFFLNGRFFTGALPEEAFRRRIDEALQAAPAPARPRR